MASIRKTKCGSWEVRVRRKGHPVQTKTFRRKINAEQWARDIENDIDRDVFRDLSIAKTMSLGDLLDRYLEKVILKKNPKSKNYSHINQIKSCIINPGEVTGRSTPELCLGDITLFELSTVMITAFRDRRLAISVDKDADETEVIVINEKNKAERRVAPATVTKEMNLISRAIGNAMREWGVFLPFGNPCEGVDRPEQPQPRKRRASEKELCDLYRHSDSELLPYICVFAVETAMRRGEIANMVWENINWSERTLDIPNTKSGEPRTIPLSKRAMQVLESLDYSEGKVWNITADTITQAFIRARDRAGIIDLHFHDLRREAISRMFEMGLKIVQVKAISGHKSVKTLTNIYTKLKVAGLVKALDQAQEGFTDLLNRLSGRLIGHAELLQIMKIITSKEYSYDEYS